ncbi:hypothetical protein OG520_41740 (plasmid) [Streptomyces sp. NBC_00984]|nr:hypothetical protein OG520_41740 [Streptomyces sp. NBC_00984]
MVVPRAYTFLSLLPTYTTPPTTAGDDVTASPVAYRHRSGESGTRAT